MVIWQWGPFNITVFSLSFSTALIIVLLATLTEGERMFLPSGKMVDFALLSLVFGIAGGRLTHIMLFNRQYYLEDLTRILKLQDGGMSLWGGLIFAFIAVSLWAWRKNLSIEKYLDAAALGLVLGSVVGYIAYPPLGKPLNSPVPWGIGAGDRQIHPDGAYMIILLSILGYLLWWRRRRMHYQGELMIWFIGGYGLCGFTVDFFRQLPRVFGGLSVGQYVSLIMVTFSLYYILAGPKTAPSSHYLSDRFFGISGHSLKDFLEPAGALVLMAGSTFLFYVVNSL